MNDYDNSLAHYIQEGRNVLNIDNPEEAHRAFYKWDQSVAQWLDSKYPSQGISAQWSSLSASTLVMGHFYQNSPSAWKIFKDNVLKRMEWLSNIAKQEFRQNLTSEKISTQPSISKKVFIVHGHNELIREKVARFVQRLELEPVILHEQPNKGRTIIEKFIDYSDVSFAIIILTADDRGGRCDDNPSTFQKRTRQNVILELGFFLGKLGRERVCVLYESGVEIPSDYQGVLFILLDDNDAWTLQMVKEMKTAGLSIDVSKLV